MKRIFLAAATLALFVVGAGCTHNTQPFRDIDLTADLGPATLQRYEALAHQATGQGMPSHGGHHAATIEHSNWWPLGLLAYWRRGSVKAIHTTSGKWNYMVTESTGLGPLAIFGHRREQASYDSSGKRLSYMAGAGLALGHPFMYHAMGARLEDGQWMEHRTWSLLHHLVNIGRAHGRTSFWLLTAPNPAGMGD